MMDDSELPKVQIVKPNPALQNKTGIGKLDEKLVKKAQTVLETNKDDFLPLGKSLLTDLSATLDAIESENNFESPERFQKVVEIVMQVKANAALFNYQLAGNLADTTLDFLEHVKKFDDSVFQLVRNYEKILRLIVNTKMSGAGGQSGQALETELKDACTRYTKKLAAADAAVPAQENK